MKLKGFFCSTKAQRKGKKEVNCSTKRMNRNLVMGNREEKLGEGRERKRGSCLWWGKDRQQSLKPTEPGAPGGSVG